jgi:hypothetical protein
MKRIFVFIFIIVCNASCLLPTLYDIKFTNNTETDVYVFIAYGLGGYYNMTYPDTTIYFSKVDRRINFHSDIKEAFWATPEEILDRISSDTLSVYYFHPDTLNVYTWEIIQRDYKILRRYDLSIEDIHKFLNKNNVPEIPYPPDDRMKNMKMYPPYKEYQPKRK